MVPQQVQALTIEVLEQDILAALGFMQNATIREGIDPYMRLFQAVQAAKQKQQQAAIAQAAQQYLREKTPDFGHPMPAE